MNEDGTKTEYRVWNPCRSKLAVAILGGVDSIWIKPGARVLYLGAASETTVSHVSDIVGHNGVVYAVEFSHRSGRDLVNMAKKRTNVIPIIEDARHPAKYRMLVGMGDVIFSDVSHLDQPIDTPEQGSAHEEKGEPDKTASSVGMVNATDKGVLPSNSKSFLQVQSCIEQHSSSIPIEQQSSSFITHEQPHLTLKSIELQNESVNEVVNKVQTNEVVSRVNMDLVVAPSRSPDQLQVVFTEPSHELEAATHVNSPVELTDTNNEVVTDPTDTIFHNVVPGEIDGSEEHNEEMHNSDLQIPEEIAQKISSYGSKLCYYKDFEGPADARAIYLHYRAGCEDDKIIFEELDEAIQLIQQKKPSPEEKEFSRFSSNLP
ncbi:hypothetical protein QQ045_020342 [Rhodiola kirilowii]